MELIIKPTERCNFKCTFCSSTSITKHKSDILEHDYIFKFLKRFPHTKTIIVNGGDPLMMEPNYYWTIIDYLDKHELSTSIALTTNLWPFYKNPQKWTSLFCNERVGVTTSFNYGDGRLKGDYSLFTEDDFWKCSNAMLEYTGYRPDFISVITDDNEHLAIKNVELAKEMSCETEPKGTLHNFNRSEKMGVECKLNYAMASGDQKNPYLLSKIYEIYLQVYNKGLAPWEFNTKQMMKRLSTHATSCPQCRSCDEGIRALNPGGDYYSCGSFGDDQDESIDFNLEMDGKFFTPLQDNINLLNLKEECFSCPMFSICNGCRKTIKDLKEADVVESHCIRMKKIAEEIIKTNVLN